MRNAAISYSKLREDFGAVGIRVMNNRIGVEFARRWHATEVKNMVNDMIHAYGRVNWNDTFIDQITGEYLINMLKRRGMPMQIITTNKLSKNAKDIEKIRVMDKIEMADFLRALKHNEQLRFPKKPSVHMQKLEAQVPMFSKHTTEAGSIDYYAPGEEPDDLVRALLIACFSVRNMIDSPHSLEPILGGIPHTLDTDPDLFGLTSFLKVM